MEIKHMSVEHLEQYNNLVSYAFQVTEKTLTECGWEREEIRKSKASVLAKANVLGAFDSDRLASQFAVYPMRMNVYNAVFDVGFITSVATYPEYSGLGLMSKLMKQSLVEMKQKGQLIALLYPYSIPLYRHKGWEIVSDIMTFAIKDYQLPKDYSVPGKVKRVGLDEKDLMLLHDRFARSKHGCMLRNELAWEEYWRWDEDEIFPAIYYNTENEPTGYVVYNIKDDKMFIKEMIYVDAEACRGLWKFIGAHESMVSEVTGNNFTNETIAFWLTDSDIKETIRPYVMGRIVDAASFIERYKFLPLKPGESVSVRIVDKLLEWNNLTFTLSCGGTESVNITYGDSDEHALELDIGIFTCVMLGYKRLSFLAKMERVAGNKKAVSTLDGIIPKDKAYISDYI